MREIKFNNNLNNKLNCNVFTTIRLYTPDKWDYYSACVRKYFDVSLNGIVLKRVSLNKAEAFKFKDIPKAITQVDVGESNTNKILKVFESFKIKPNSKVILLTFSTSNTKTQG